MSNLFDRMFPPENYPKYMFRLLKDFGDHKADTEFDCCGGNVRGISTKSGATINFDDSDYFEYVGEVENNV
jgi:hypothetical protein